MGRKNLESILKGHWRSRKFISRSNPNQIKRIEKKEKIVKKLISFLEKDSILISKLEYHHLSSSIIFIIYGIKKSIKSSISINLIPIITHYLEKLFNKKIELYFINLSYPYLDPQILSQYILMKLNRSQRISSITKILNPLQKLVLKNSRKENNINKINGIRVEIKGLSGKMAMSKKLIKSIGSHQFNSSNSIIEYGFAKSLNKKGITGIKVWISYSPIKK